ncbi:hypothetical protein LYNGBM3L_38360 [Moorena producens 3L]|uniref:Uncharacterized protein n=1 Tax=Moorena producens 3L TaxID=489825 RepID=F4XV27_9CYAN|nr:hypothetical protein LYNGBM3L_38360 [Moorena producens 3L]
MLRYRVPGFREQRIWEQGTDKMEEGIGNSEQGKKLVYLIRLETAIGNRELT